MFSFLKNLFGSAPPDVSNLPNPDPPNPVSAAFRTDQPPQGDAEAQLKSLYDLASSSSEPEVVQFLLESQRIQAGVSHSYGYEKTKEFWKSVQVSQPEARLGHFIYLLAIEALKAGKLSDLLQSFPQEQITYAIASLSLLVEQEHSEDEASADNTLKTLLYGLTKESLSKRPDQDLFDFGVEFNKAYEIFAGYDLQEQMNQALGSVKPNYDQIHFIANLTGNTLVNFQMVLVNLAKNLQAKGETAHLLLYDNAFPGRLLSDETTQMIETLMQHLNSRLKVLSKMVYEDPHNLTRNTQQLLTEISEDSFLFFCTPRLGHHTRIPAQFKDSLRAEVTDVYRVVDLVEVS